MKIIKRPAVREEADYTCDLTGKPINEGLPCCLSLQFGYGSTHDGEAYEFHFSEEAEQVLLPVLRTLLLEGQTMLKHRTQNEFGRDDDDEVLSGHERAQALEKFFQFLEVHGKKKDQPTT
jgi:hypothetical protein